ncbi:hypothetical protein [Flavisphingomonas formosensis]|nr:hypothetical protein [Sphingomonas formosensis]
MLLTMPFAQFAKTDALIDGYIYGIRLTGSSGPGQLCSVGTIQR